MRTAIVVLAIATSLVACGRATETEPGGNGTAPLVEILADPDAFEGQRVEVSTGYFSSFEVSVLTSGFAESYPPQPVDPLVWVSAGPPRSCLEVAERVSWSERVIATGIFRTGGGFGHLGQYEFELTEPTLRCG